MSKQISNRRGKYQFAGKLSDFQKLEANPKSFVKYEQDKYTAYQNYLYKRALHGLRSLSKEEYDKTGKEKRKRISRVYLRGQKVINKLKQESTNKYSNFIFQTLFPDAPLTDWLINNSSTDDKFKNTLTFNDLNITKDDIVKEFIKEGILPKNFMSLEKSSSNLPRLKYQCK
tara:strand:+ start:687 stop:1202 length:516 start_codon:yes stop_codon:yes gene_type:complete